MSGKRRVYELARELGMDNKTLLSTIESVGVPDVKNHMSVLSSEDEEKVKHHLGKPGDDSSDSSGGSARPRVVKRRAVVRRRKSGDPDEAAADASPRSVESAKSAETEGRVVARRSESKSASDSAPSKSAPVASETGAQASTKSGDSAADASAAQQATTAESAQQKATQAAASDRALTADSAATPAPSKEASSVPAGASSQAASPQAADESQAAPAGVASSSSSSDSASAGAAQGSAAAQGSTAEQGAASTQTASKTSEPKTNPAAKQAVQPEAAAEQSAAGNESKSTSQAKEDESKGAAAPSSASAPDAQGSAASQSSAGSPSSAASESGAEKSAAAKPAVTAPRAPEAPAAAAAAARPSQRPAATSNRPAGAPSVVPPSARPSAPPKRGIDVWEGRPGVPMHNHRPGPRRVQYDAKAPAPAGGGGNRRGPGGRMMRGGNRQRGIGSFSRTRGGGPVTKERNAHKKVVRIEETVTLQTLAGHMGVKSTDLLRKLFALGMPGININSTLDADTAKIVGEEFGWEVEDVAVSEEDQLKKAQGVEPATDEDDADLEPRPPVVTVMGHVDHGKTSLLDSLRESNVVSGEAGGITQHIGAYSVKTPRGKITFLDTPGHAAFTQMRARGAQATDIVVLVVAADDGVMPQTKEAISHSKAADVPIVVAINKCDKPDAQPERVRRELSEQGLVPEEWGGETLFCEVSAHTKEGIPELLDKLVLQAEMMELRANPNKPASGIVIEAQVDRGRGPVATVLVTEGTLNKGDVVLAGAAFGKARAMHDSMGRSLKHVGPADPVAIVGLSEVPRAGDQVYVVKNLRTAQEIADTRKVKERRSLAPSAGNKPRTLEEIAKLMSEDAQLELKVIVKADVAGSAEAVSEALQQLTTEKVRVSVVLQAAGGITENDVNLASAAGAIIVGFNAKPAGKAAAVAQREGIEIRQYSIIYALLDDVRLAMEGLLAPTLVEKDIGSAEVRQTFRISKAGTVAGSMVTSGIIKRGAGARLERDGEIIWTGKVSGLKRFKEDVREVKDGFECGISLEDMNEVHVGDIIHAFDVEEVKQSL